MPDGGGSNREEHRPDVAKLYVRNDAPFVARDRVREVQSRLQDAGVEVTVDHWGRRIPWDDAREAHDAFETFAEWAASEGVSLEPAFQRSCHTSHYTGEAVEVLVPPVVTLVAYDRDESQPLAVYPHRDGKRQVSVEDGLKQLEQPRSIRPA
ncbi:HTH domain-containing protein [Halorarius litoreus]|uniref:HTH domain-containing protein n=1 Tax=Halorarius litoreus TaxID=2962676 RepID=UPI0020CDB54E|nr:HTH domain-containing protein [Halorarius litoreus]